MQVRSLASIITTLGPGVAMSCGVGHRCGSDPALLWLWCSPAAVALIPPLAWEPPHGMDASLKRPKKKDSVFPVQVSQICLTVEHIPFPVLSAAPS